MESTIADQLPGTVVITDFADRRSREVARGEIIGDQTLEPGTRLDRYLIIERLGGGGMGVVYKAQDTELRRTVALKVLPPHLCRHPEYLHRFRSEAQAQARLNSPYVVTLYSLLELPVGEVLVLEYSEGQTLEQRLRSGGPLTPEQAAPIFEQALRGVEHIHSMGVVHRDLKPANIFLTRDGRVKLIDFGVAKIMDQPERSAHRTMVGTLLYISPEQINGHSTDFRSDIYTLGISLFEAVTGRLPFERRTDYALMHAHVQETPPRPRNIQRRVPAEMETVILRAIEKDPNRRFQSAAEFRNALLSIIEQHQYEVSKRTDAPPQYGRRREDSEQRGSHRLLGGLWLDTAMVVTVVGLVYGLGIYPAKPTGDQVPQPPLGSIGSLNPPKPAPAPLTKRNASPSPSANSPSSKPATPNAAAPPAPGDEPPKKYDSLREAWGG